METSTLVFIIVGGIIGLWLLVMATIAIVRDGEKYCCMYKVGKKKVYMLKRTKAHFDNLLTKFQSVVEAEIITDLSELGDGNYLAIINYEPGEKTGELLMDVELVPFE